MNRGVAQYRVVLGVSIRRTDTQGTDRPEATDVV